MGAAPDDPVALYFGRIAPEMNLPPGLETSRQLRGVHPKLKMVLVGDSPSVSSGAGRYPELLWAGRKRGGILAALDALADRFLFHSETDRAVVG